MHNWQKYSQYAAGKALAHRQGKLRPVGKSNPPHRVGLDPKKVAYCARCHEWFPSLGARLLHRQILHTARFFP